MDTDAKGQLGGMDASEEVRKRLAGQSKMGRCVACGKSNEEIMREQDEAVKAQGGDAKQETIPEELRLAYRDDLSKDDKTKAETSKSSAPPPAPAAAVAAAPVPTPTTSTTTQTRPASGPAPVPTATAAAATQQQQRRQPAEDEGIPAWIDKAIYGVIGAIIFLLWKKYYF